MIDFFLSYRSVADVFMVNAILACSQYIALRAGVFSLGTAAFAGLGAYCVAWLVMRAGFPPSVATVVAMALGGVLSALLALPLSRLRGVFQALATLALVQIVLSGTLNLTELTNGALGINGIPRAIGTLGLLGVVFVVVYILLAIEASSIGRAFNVIREDETVAVALGISVDRYQIIAFILSGVLAGLAGSLYAFTRYTIIPTDFGFHMLINVLAMVVLGGRLSVWGALVGAAILSILPEVFRVFADYRMEFQGGLLMLCIIFLPRGVADSVIAWHQERRLKAQLISKQEVSA